MTFNYIKKMPTVEEAKAKMPLPAHLKPVKEKRDQEIRAIFEGKDKRFLIIVGPCSADNEDAVCDYVNRLAAVQEQTKDRLLIIPRIYTNKPRTTGEGYKGMLHQPDPSQEPNLTEGLYSIRKMQIRAFTESGLTAADEMLYPSNYPYLEDVLSYSAVGARSVENQQHRLTASGVNDPVGMKNPTSGDIGVMFNSIQAAQQPHSFVYNGFEVRTSGNPLAHAILRGFVSKGGDCRSNYHYEDLHQTATAYLKKGFVNPTIIVDTNHANSNKQYKEQVRIAREVMYSRRYNKLINEVVKGLMIESYLEEGAQKIGDNVYGKSITDPCLGWKDTEKLLLDIAGNL